MNKIIIANWKESPESFDKAKKLIQETINFQEKNKIKSQIFFASPAIYISELLKVSKNVILQDIFTEESGAFTGKFGAKMSKSLGIKMSIVGHSETRFSSKNKKGDTNQEIATKVRNLLDNKMSICLCIGEEIRNKNYKDFIKKQILEALSLTKKEEFKSFIFAYEPVWAIGKDAKRPATNTEIQETILFIKEVLTDFFTEKFAKQIPILYGGSVSSENAKSFLEQDFVGGLLIGRASGEVSEWKKILSKIV